MKKRGYVLPALLLLWIAFIFFQSLQPVDESREESLRVLELLQQLGLTGLTNHIVRKLAHFTEFTVLGVIAGLLLGRSFRVWWTALLFSLSVGLLVAVCDETIQLFVEGRGSQLSDVWLDFSGATVGTIATTAILRLSKNCGC